VSGTRDIYFSFFMFTTNLQPGDPEMLKSTIRHIRELTGQGYTGFDMPIFPAPVTDHAPEVEAYAELRRSLDSAGLSDVAFTTNVAATKTFDPSSPYAEQRQAALAYLISRVDITAALGGSILGGPTVIPYNQFPSTDFGDPIWSDALQRWASSRYEAARPVFEQVGEHAEGKGVRLAIEPVDHWETPGPNMVGDVRAFIEGVRSQHVGACVDSAHVVLGSSGPAVFVDDITELAAARRIHYVQVSAPDRGAVKDSWIPWDTFLGTVLPAYDGPLLLEVFNAIPAFLTPLHLTRRKFWIPGEDSPVPGVPDAYTVAGEGFDALIGQLQRFEQKGAQ
jgi:D-psicose/D-tagatose/L-ribulose 3-epimerase